MVKPRLLPWRAYLSESSKKRLKFRLWGGKGCRLAKEEGKVPHIENKTGEVKRRGELLSPRDEPPVPHPSSVPPVRSVREGIHRNPANSQASDMKNAAQRKTSTSRKITPNKKGRKNQTGRGSVRAECEKGRPSTKAMEGGGASLLISHLGFRREGWPLTAEMRRRTATYSRCAVVLRAAGGRREWKMNVKR